MSDMIAPARPKTQKKTERPPMWKVILLNDDFTPRGFVTKVLMSVFRMTEGEAEAVMLAAHLKGACVVAVYTREIAETKAQMGNDAGARLGYPLTFTTERDS
ncbi:MAG: ATP-dependent Clp protease adaptor ClpS [Pseudomonadota bacterium]